MATSASDYNSYREFCREAATNDMVYSGFRRSYIYNVILENVPERAGKECLDILVNAGINDISLFSCCDDYGMPIMYYYGKYGSWSPTTLRYIKVYLDLLVGYEKPITVKQPIMNLDNSKIIEVGGGYGGQANVIKFKHNTEHHIYDLPEPLMLTERYLKEFNREIIPHNALEPIEENSCDLFISNCAISELNKEIQDEYLNKIIPNSKNGYITYNNFKDAYSPQEFFDKIKNIHTNAREFVENPVTGPNNKAITW